MKLLNLLTGLLPIGEKLVELVKDNENDWVGLAANQIGIDAKVFAIALQGNFKGTYKYFVNPKIYSKDSENSTYEEGCLSVPNYIAEVDRQKKCKV